MGKPMADSCWCLLETNRYCKAVILQLKINKFWKKMVICDERWILYNNQWQLPYWLNREELQSTSEAKLAPKKGHDHSLLVYCPSDLLKLSESRQNHYIWEVCSANWWDNTENCNAYNQHWSTEWAQLFSRTMPDHMSHNQCTKSWTYWAMKFCFICHVHLPSHQFTDSSIVYHFLQGKWFHNQQEAENAFFQDLVES